MEEQFVTRKLPPRGSLANPLRVRFWKLDDNAVMPVKNVHSGNSVFFLFALDSQTDKYGVKVVRTGIVVEIPRGYIGLVLPNRNLAKHGCYLSNSANVLVSGCRKEIAFNFAARTVAVEPADMKGRLLRLLGKKEWMKGKLEMLPVWPEDSDFEEGECIGKLIVVPHPVAELDDTCEIPGINTEDSETK